MPTVEISGEVEVWCATCGAGLCLTVTTNGSSVNVPPCERCMENARQEGYGEGHTAGYDEGYGDGEALSEAN